MKNSALAVVLCALCGAAARPISTEAHTLSLSFAEVEIREQEVRWLVRMPLPEVQLLFDLDRNHDGAVDERELQGGSEQLGKYLKSKVEALVQGRPLWARLGPFRLWDGTESHSFVETEMVFPSDERLSRLTLRCELLREVVSTHRTLARIQAGGRTQQLLFDGRQSHEIEIGSARLVTIVQFIRLGILHILTGYDHIAFLVGIVLIGGSFKRMVVIVTSFTVAHSITLALAGLDLVRLPIRLVETGIALSIMYIAVENIFFTNFDRRWLVTFFFGLVHGFGFAHTLREVHLARGALVSALFSFNLGVEIGQVCIVAVLLPLLWTIKGKSFNPLFVKLSSTVIFLLGSVWFWQRITGG